MIVKRFKLLLLQPLLAACSALGASVTLAWDASPSAEVNGYNIYVGGASGVYTNYTSVGNVTNATLGGLVDGRTYFFAATAISTNGLESVFSNEVEYRVPVDTPFHFPLDPIALFIAQNWEASFLTNAINELSPGYLSACYELDLWNRETGERISVSDLAPGNQVAAVLYLKGGAISNQPLDFLAIHRITIPQ